MAEQVVLMVIQTFKLDTIFITDSQNLTVYGVYQLIVEFIVFRVQVTSNAFQHFLFLNYSVMNKGQHLPDHPDSARQLSDLLNCGQNHLRALRFGRYYPPSCSCGHPAFVRKFWSRTSASNHCIIEINDENIYMLYDRVIPFIESVPSALPCLQEQLDCYYQFRKVQIRCCHKPLYYLETPVLYLNWLKSLCKSVSKFAFTCFTTCRLEPGI